MTTVSSTKPQAIPTEAETEGGTTRNHSQVVRLLRVQVVPAAGLRGCLGWGLQLCWAGAGRSGQETALGGVGNGDRGPAALLLHHCLDWAQRDSINTTHSGQGGAEQDRKLSDCRGRMETLSTV